MKPTTVAEHTEDGRRSHFEWPQLRATDSPNAHPARPEVGPWHGRQRPHAARRLMRRWV